MPGKPFQSKLKPYETELRELLASGGGFRGAAQEINRRHGLNVSHNAVFSFLKSRPAPRSERGLFYEGLPTDLRDQLLKRLSAEWTHESTAIEGNTLTLGETHKVLELGLTIGGKPLRDHQEVYGHARAIDLIYESIGFLTRIKGSQMSMKNLSSKHLHSHHFLSISIFLEPARTTDNVFDVGQNPITDRTQM